MFTTILRLGPFVLVQFIAAAAAVVCSFMRPKNTCYYYCLGELAFSLFIIETIIALNLIKKHASLQRTYIADRSQEKTISYYFRQTWDNFNIVVVLATLASAVIKDTITLIQKDEQDFTLAPICLAPIDTHSQSLENKILLWFIYAFTVVFVTILIIFVSREMTHYANKLIQNRNLGRQLSNLNQTLLDSQIFDTIQTPGQECAICLHGLQISNRKENEKIIKLRCGHYFHQECIQMWTKVKDGCPYRCEHSLN